MSTFFHILTLAEWKQLQNNLAFNFQILNIVKIHCIFVYIYTLFVRAALGAYFRSYVAKLVPVSARKSNFEVYYLAIPYSHTFKVVMWYNSKQLIGQRSHGPGNEFWNTGETADLDRVSALHAINIRCFDFISPQLNISLKVVAFGAVLEWSIDTDSIQYLEFTIKRISIKTTSVHH